MPTNDGDKLEALPVPPGARLYYQNDKGQPCRRSEAYLWTWEGGPAWFQTGRRREPDPHAVRRAKRLGLHIYRPDQDANADEVFREALNATYRELVNDH